MISPINLLDMSTSTIDSAKRSPLKNVENIKSLDMLFPNKFNISNNSKS